MTASETLKNYPDQIQGVPTNIITGFLGAGKTSAILQLLKTKPEQERWAILVNEFGEIGIDGALIGGQHSEEDGVFIREVPGGCMCCTAGLPMQVALTQLLRRARPDRLLIEPTGLGHPEEVLHTLASDQFKQVLTIQNTITLVDARQVSDRRYAEHQTFQQQIAIADVVVGNKQDLYTKDDKAALKHYLEQHAVNSYECVFTEYGQLDLSLLGSTRLSMRANQNGFVSPVVEEPEPEIPDSGFIKALNKGQGFNSIGWRFAANQVFDRTKLFAFLSGIEAQRLKAAFITDQGYFAYNLARHTLTEVALNACEESRIEIINEHIDHAWEADLFDCILPPAQTQITAVLSNR